MKAVECVMTEHNSFLVIVFLFSSLSFRQKDLVMNQCQTIAHFMLPTLQGNRQLGSNTEMLKLQKAVSFCINIRKRTRSQNGLLKKL